MRSFSLSHLTGAQLDLGLETAARDTAGATASLLAHLAEFDLRRRYLPRFRSMFDYCVRHLRFSEDEACKRLDVARLARRFPAILPAIAERRLHMTAVLMLSPHLMHANGNELIAAACDRTKAEIQLLLAERFPRPDLPARLSEITPPALGQGATLGIGAQPAPERITIASLATDARSDTPQAASGTLGIEAQSAPERITSPGKGADSPPPPPRGCVAPLAPGRFGLQCTLAHETYEKLQYLKSLLSHQVPNGELTQVLDRAFDAAIRELERRKFAATDRPRPPKQQPGAGANPRHVPAAVKRAVWARDRGRCTFVSERGHRCEARDHLEFDHEVPVARGGRSTTGNLRLRCRVHNQYEAERAFGEEFMRRKREHSRDAGVARTATPDARLTG